MNISGLFSEDGCKDALIESEVPHGVRPVVVIPHERVEGAQLHPPHAQLLSGVASEAADVSPDERHPEQTELQHRWGVKNARRGLKALPSGGKP